MILLENNFLSDDWEAMAEKISENDKKHLGILLSFISGNLLVHSDTIDSYQNTSKSNHANMLKDFIGDVNFSAKIIEKALMALMLNTEHRLIRNNAILIGHSFSAEEGRIVSNTIKTTLEKYLKHVEKATEILLRLTSSRDNIRLTGTKKKDAEDGMQSILKKKSYRYYCPNYRYYFLGPLVSAARFSSLSDEEEKAVSIFAHRKNSSENYIFYPLYLSCALWEEKIIPSKTQNIQIREDGFIFDINLSNSCKVSKTTMSIKGNWDVDYGLQYYIKKYLIESITGRSLSDFFVVYKDYLAKELFAETYKENPNGFHSDHPMVISIKAYNEMRNDIELKRKEYKENLIKLQRLIDYHEKEDFLLSSKEWTQKFNLNVNPRGVSPDDKVSSVLIFNMLNQSTMESANKIISNHLLLENKEFINYLKLDASVDTIVQTILNIVHGSSSCEIEHLFNKDFASSGRGSIQTIIQNSIILDYRDKNNPKLNDKAKELLQKNKYASVLYEILRTSSYHDLYELDLDILCQDSIFSLETLGDYIAKAASLALPFGLKTSFKLRKLGNYKASGIYFLHTRTMALEYRRGKNGKRAFMHEVAHHIDLTAEHEQRGSMIKKLFNYFSPILTEKRDYFLREEELIARGAEIAKILYISNYMALKKTVSMKEMADIMRKRFDNSVEAEFMCSWNDYNTSAEYISIESCIDSGRIKLLDDVYWYFQQFWNNRIVNFVIDDDSTASTFSPRKSGLVSSAYILNNIYKAELENISEKIIASNYVKFILQRIPCSTPREKEDFEKNIITIKKAWLSYLKHGECGLSEFLNAQLFQPYITLTAYNHVSKAFALKYKSDSNYNERLKEFKYVLGSIYLRGATAS